RSLFGFLFLLLIVCVVFISFFFSSRRRHTRFKCDWSSDVCSSDLRDLGDTLTVRIAEVTSPRAERARRHERALWWIRWFGIALRSEERRVGKECRWRGWREQREDKEERERQTVKEVCKRRIGRSET